MPKHVHNAVSFLILRASLKDVDRLFGIVHHVDFRYWCLVVQLLHAHHRYWIGVWFHAATQGNTCSTFSRPLKNLQPIIHRKLEYKYITEQSPRFDVDVSDENISFADFGAEVTSWHRDEWMLPLIPSTWTRLSCWFQILDILPSTTRLMTFGSKRTRLPTRRHLVEPCENTFVPAAESLRLHASDRADQRN